tara:strand:- start:464 stop:667 length:204 start_codon:yes stop_codon:yes gene_type:complete
MNSIIVLVIKILIILYNSIVHVIAIAIAIDVIVVHGLGKVDVTCVRLVLKMDFFLAALSSAVIVLRS